MKLYRKFGKRTLDIVVSAAALPFIAIIALPISAAIKKEDGGSVFYLGERYGEDMKKFRMYKFRTMKENAPDLRNADGTTFNSETDPRLTKVGAFLRKTSIDELPQILNVFLGHMSFVGPRPSPMGNEKTYTDYVKQKFEVKPGITGLNQAVLRNKATLEERYANDVYYAQNLSFMMDLKILIKTFFGVMKHDNIYKS